MDMSDPIGSIIGLALVLTVPIYAVLQILALWRWRGLSFWLALIPLAVMGWAVSVHLDGSQAGSNLAPIFIIVAAPLCLFWLWLVRALRR